MPRNRGHSRALLRRSRAARDPARRYVDLAIQFRVEDGPDAGLLTRPFGGVWDKRRGEYAGIWDPDADGWVGRVPERIHVVPVAAQSLEFIVDFDHTLILALGGRRSGKTTGSLAPKIVVLLLCLVGLPGEVLSPTYRQARNVWKAVLKITPRAWWTHLHKTEHRMELINGSSVTLLSADNEDSARSEGVAWGAYDERQDIPEEAAANAFLSTSEGGGHVYVFETGTIKPELREHYDRLMASPHARVYRMRSRGNPFISHQLFDMAEQLLDAATVKRELEAEWPDPIGRCYSTYDEGLHKRDSLHGFEDITAAYCAEHWDMPAYGPGAGHFIIGVDPPHHATVNVIYRDEISHTIDEIVIGADGRDGDVRDLAKRCAERCGGKRGVVIFDPHESHWDDDVRKYFKNEGFRIVNMKRVSVELRLTAARARFEHLRHFVASRCVLLREALRDQLYVNGKPDKMTKSKIVETMSMDHIADALGYFLYKCWPAKIDYEKLERMAA